jgi:large subunit ribosomal protein L4
MTMAGVQIYNVQGKVVGSVNVPTTLEGPANEAVLWQSVRMYLANQREGNADTKRRGEVEGGGKKPWKQKHTGRARAGSTRSPIWRKGGITFGPHPREHRYALPQKLRKVALVNSLKAKFGRQEVAVLETVEGLQSKTKELAGLLKKMDACCGALVVVENPTPELVRSARNMPKVAVRKVSDLNSYEVLSTPKLVVTSGALKQLEALSK